MRLCLSYSNAKWLSLCFKHTVSLEIIVLKRNSFTSTLSNYWVLYDFVVLVTFQDYSVDSISCLLSFENCGIILNHFDYPEIYEILGSLDIFHLFNLVISIMFKSKKFLSCMYSLQYTTLRKEQRVSFQATYN